MAAPAHAAVVINEVYGGGGNSGAQFKNDFVELYNNGTTAVDLTGFSVQYASSAGAFTPANSANLTGSIAPGGFYLVQFASGGAVGAALPTARATGSANLSATVGKVALANNATPVTFDAAPTPDTFSANTLDFVGFGATPNAFEGAGAAPAGSNTASITRNATGTDTNNNNQDFSVLTPPTPTDGGGTVSGSAGNFQFSAATLSVAENGGTATFTVTRTGGTTGAVAVNYATSDGTATAGADYTATSGTLNFADGQTTATFSVPILDDSIVESNETVAVTLSGATGGAMLGTPNPATLTIRENDRVAGNFLINEIKNDAPGNDAPQEFVELRGPAGAALTNVSLVYVPGDDAFPASIGTARAVIDLTGAAIGSNGLLVIKSPTGGPTIPAGTTVVTDAIFDATGATGAFLNGTGTFLLVFTPSAPVIRTVDYDTNNDGTFEAGNALASAERLDSVTVFDGNDNDIFYSPAVLRLGTGSTGTGTTGNSSPEAENAVPDALTRFQNNSTPQSAAAFFYGELAGTTNDSLDYDETTPGVTVSSNFPTGYDLTPGAANVVTTTSATSGAIISEFRFHGATGTTDEYVELRNKLNAPLNISGWSIQTRTAAGLQTTTVPANTTIPVFGHFLFTGAGYSLTGYGTSNQTIATDVLDNSGVALFNASGALQDAVGFAASDTTLREGAGLPNYPTTNGEYAFLRDFIISQEKDTSDSTNDFVFVSTSGAGVAGESAPGVAATVAAQLGAPNPEGLLSPAYFNNQTLTTLLDTTVAAGSSPNRVRVRDTGLGFLVVRRTIKNNSLVPIKQLRFSVTAISSLGSAGDTGAGSGQADVRLISQPAETGVALANGTLVNVEGTTLEAGTGQPQQPLGGGLGSSLDNGTVNLSTPLAPGATRNYAFRLQIVRLGNFFIALNILALPQ